MINTSFLEYFDKLSEATQIELLKPQRLLCYQKGESLFSDHELVESVFILLSGKAAIYKITENGQKKVVFILGPGEIINGDIQPALTASAGCEAFENTEVICIEKIVAERLMQRDFELTRWFLDAANRKIRRLYRQLKNTVGVLKIEKRVAAKLWKLAKDYGDNTKTGREINLHISITYLADLMGSPRETISRALKTLVQNNLILQNQGKIVIVSMDALAAFFKK